MVDRQQSSKEYYQQQLAQAAWMGFSRGPGGYSASNPHAAGFNASQGQAGTGSTGSANAYENYMQQLQQFAGLSSQSNPGMFAGAPNFLGNGNKDLGSGFTAPFGFPNSHPMAFQNIANYSRPLPAHSPLPAHLKNSSANPSTPLPAHIRSSPYQQNYQSLNSPYLNAGSMNPGYLQANVGGSQQQASTQEYMSQLAERTRQQFDNPRSQYSSSKEQQSNHSRQDAARRTALLNGGTSPGGAANINAQATMAFNQLQQLHAAYSQAATGSTTTAQKEPGTKAKTPSNNNYPFYQNNSQASSGSGSSGPAFNSLSANTNSEPQYDQIAAALLNRFGTQFSPQLLMEMTKGYQQQVAAATVNPLAQELPSRTDSHASASRSDGKSGASSKAAANISSSSVNHQKQLQIDGMLNNSSHLGASKVSPAAQSCLPAKQDARMPAPNPGLINGPNSYPGIDKTPGGLNTTKQRLSESTAKAPSNAFMNNLYQSKELKNQQLPAYLSSYQDNKVAFDNQKSISVQGADKSPLISPSSSKLMNASTSCDRKNSTDNLNASQSHEGFYRQHQPPTDVQKNFSPPSGRNYSQGPASYVPSSNSFSTSAKALSSYPSFRNDSMNFLSSTGSSESVSESPNSNVPKDVDVVKKTVEKNLDDDRNSTEKSNDLFSKKARDSPRLDTPPGLNIASSVEEPVPSQHAHQNITTTSALPLSKEPDSNTTKLTPLSELNTPSAGRSPQHVPSTQEVIVDSANTSSGPSDKLKDMQNNTPGKEEETLSMGKWKQVEKAEEESTLKGLWKFQQEIQKRKGTPPQSTYSVATAGASQQPPSPCNNPPHYDRIEPSYEPSCYRGGSSISPKAIDSKYPEAPAITNSHSDLYQTMPSPHYSPSVAPISNSQLPSGPHISPHHAPTLPHTSPLQTSPYHPMSPRQSPAMSQISSHPSPALSHMSQSPSPAMSQVSPHHSPMSQMSPHRSPSMGQMVGHQSPSVSQSMPHRSPSLSRLSPHHSPSLIHSPHQSPSTAQLSPHHSPVSQVSYFQSLSSNCVGPLPMQPSPHSPTSDPSPSLSSTGYSGQLPENSRKPFAHPSQVGNFGPKTGQTTTQSESEMAEEMSPNVVKPKDSVTISSVKPSSVNSEEKSDNMPVHPDVQAQKMSNARSTPPIGSSSGSPLPSVVHSSSLYATPNLDRMEIKNSGIPGPGAVTWKRKSTDDPPTGGPTKKKRVEATIPEDDVYSFEEEDRPQAGQQPAKDENLQKGPVYKCKSAWLSRDGDDSRTEATNSPQGLDSPEDSQLDRGASPQNPKKRNKKPRHELWSVIDDGKKTTESDSNDTAVKKSSTWGLSIASKTSHKNGEKDQDYFKPVAKETKPAKESKASVNEVWLQAFGASSSKNRKKEIKVAKEPSSSVLPRKNGRTETESKPPKSWLDIPPELRRKRRPDFGGLIHFSPDWSRAVKRHQERCRVPVSLVTSARIKPKILAKSTPKKNQDNHINEEIMSPPDLFAIERERLEAKSYTELSNHFATPAEEELPGQLPSIIESILSNRKKLRQVNEMGRMYKTPSHRIKRKKSQDEAKTLDLTDAENNLGLLPTPGLPLLTSETKDVLLGNTSNQFGNFRRVTLHKHIEFKVDKKESKASFWSNEILDSKRRRSTVPNKTTVNFKEIFGLEVPLKKGKAKLKERTMPTIAEVKERESDRLTIKEKVKKEPKEKVVKRDVLPPPVPKEFDDLYAFTQELGEPTEADTNLQTELGSMALELLDENPSWSKHITIQNLVVWEAVEPVAVKKRKHKKKRGRRSGLDFNAQRKRPKTSRDVSRAGSPEQEEVFEIDYTLDNVIQESNRWVVDKNAGETILHRASKMGYPDVVAYSLAMQKVSVMEKDYAGLTPLHKAAFKGHESVVKLLLMFGADPSSGVKGTRALHEAIEGGSMETVRVLLGYGADPLLHDYSGNMPIDLAEVNPTMKQYLYNLLSDLHGKPPNTKGITPQVLRWNVSHCPEFHDPRLDPRLAPVLDNDHAEGPITEQGLLDTIGVSFEVAGHELPTEFQLVDKEGDFILYRELKDFAKRQGHHKGDIRSKCSFIEVKKSEFLKTSHCKLLDRRNLEIRYHEREEEDTIILVKVDKHVRKILNAESFTLNQKL